MIYTLRGQVIKKDIDFFVLEQSGIGFKVLTTDRTIAKLPALGSEINIFCFLYFNLLSPVKKFLTNKLSRHFMQLIKTVMFLAI